MAGVNMAGVNGLSEQGQRIFNAMLEKAVNMNRELRLCELASLRCSLSCLAMH